MKRFFNFSSLIFNFYKAYQSLRDWFDPAMEGSPYAPEMKENDYPKPITRCLNQGRLLVKNHPLINYK